MGKLVAALAALFLSIIASPANAELVKATFSGDLTGTFTYSTDLEPFSTSLEYNRDNNEWEAWSTLGRGYLMTLDAFREGDPVTLQDRDFAVSMYHFLDRDTGLFIIRGYELSMMIYVAAKFPAFGLPTSADITDSFGTAYLGPNGDYYGFDVRFAPYVYSPAPAVPETATWAMMILGFGVIGYAMRRRRSTVSSVGSVG